MVTHESTELRSSKLRHSEVKDSVMVVVRDTVLETKTITITKNEAGDTTFTSVVTERERAREKSRHDMATYRTEVRRDTVYVAVRDSVDVRRYGATEAIQSGGTALHGTLKWVFWIVVALIGLVIVVKWKRF